MQRFLHTEFRAPQSINNMSINQSCTKNGICRVQLSQGICFGPAGRMTSRIDVMNTSPSTVEGNSRASNAPAINITVDLHQIQSRSSLWSSIYVNSSRQSARSTISIFRPAVNHPTVKTTSTSNPYSDTHNVLLLLLLQPNQPPKQPPKGTAEPPLRPRRVHQRLSRG